MSISWQPATTGYMILIVNVQNYQVYELNLVSKQYIKVVNPYKHRIVEPTYNGSSEYICPVMPIVINPRNSD